MLRRVGPFLLALSLLGVLSTDLVTAGHLQAQARAADVARAAALYRAQLRPVIEGVYDVVQPMQDAVDEFYKPGPDVDQVVADVLGRSDADSSLADRNRDLTRIKVPKPLATQARDLTKALDGIVHAVAALESSSQHLSGGEFGPAADGLAADLLTWSTAVAKVFQQPPMPSRAASGRRLATRDPASRPALIATFDRICSASSDRGAGLPPIHNAAQFEQAGPRYAKLIRSTISALKAVTVPRSERDPVRRQISSYYARSGDVATGIDNVISAVASSNPLAVRRGLATLRGGLISSLAMSKGFRRYGATVCADYFLVPSQEIDGLAPPPAPPQPANSYLRPAALTTAANGSAPFAPGLVATHPQG